MKKAETSEEKLSPLERFEKVMRSLIAVPKKELDEKLAEYKRQKTKKIAIRS